MHSGQQRHLQRKIERRRRHPTGRLEFLDAIAGKNKRDDVEQHPGGAEEIFQWNLEP